MKQCSRCREYKPIDEFTKASRNRDGLSYYCKHCKSLIGKEDYSKARSCRLSKHREWRQENRSQWLNITRNQNYRNLYGVDLPIDIDFLFDLQDAKCLYCSCQIYDGNLHIDHITPMALSKLMQMDCHDPTNFALTCESCNLSKSGNVLETWLEWRFPSTMDEILARVERHQFILRQEYKTVNR